MMTPFLCSEEIGGKMGENEEKAKYEGKIGGEGVVLILMIQCCCCYFHFFHICCCCLFVVEYNKLCGEGKVGNLNGEDG
jgi:hypothetical protein